MSSNASSETYFLRVSAATDTGRVRKQNEDAHIVVALGTAKAASVDAGQEVRFDPQRQPVLLAVSDGMGGAAAGEVASALVVESLRRELPATSGDWGTTLQQAVLSANEHVLDAANEPSRRGMGATLTAICVHGGEAEVAEVGDSRAYLLRNGTLSQVTHDQSYVQALVDSGVMTPAEAKRSPHSHVLTAAMGQKAQLRVDLKKLSLQPGDKLLVCCDGLSNEVEASDIQDVLRSIASPADACATLVKLANEHGGHDNITVVVAALEPSGLRGTE